MIVRRTISGVCWRETAIIAAAAPSGCHNYGTNTAQREREIAFITFICALLGVVGVLDASSGAALSASLFIRARVCVCASE